MGTPAPFHRRLTAVAALAVVLTGVWLAGPGGTTPAALATVEHRDGYWATVLGWTSWYGSYGLGAQGWGWCIDHGSAAPDPAYGYVPVDIDAETDGDAQAAMAWAAGRTSPADALDAAAVMLVEHDLRRAVYPFGRLDLDTLRPDQLSGFGGAEATLLERARALKADALAHAHLRGPLQLELTAEPVPAGASGRLWAVLRDAQGAPVAGAPVTGAATGATLTSPAEAVTGDDGLVTFAFAAGEGDVTFTASAWAPDPRPQILGSTTVPAQRIIRPTAIEVTAATGFTIPTTTTTTTSTTTTSTTTTTIPTTTTTSTTTTTIPTTTTSTSTTSTTTVPTTTSTTIPATTTTTKPPTKTLPVTGSHSVPLALVGAGLLLLGTATVRLARP